MNNDLCGIRVLTNPNMPLHPEKYVPPQERFFEYEERDHSWLKFFGLGHYEPDKDQLLFVWMNRSIVTHPDNFERLKRQLAMV